MAFVCLFAFFIHIMFILQRCHLGNILIFTQITQHCSVRKICIKFILTESSSSRELPHTSFPSLRQTKAWMDSSSCLPFFTNTSIATLNRRGREKGGTVFRSPLKERPREKQEHERDENWSRSKMPEKQIIVQKVLNCTFIMTYLCNILQKWLIHVPSYTISQPLYH